MKSLRLRLILLFGIAIVAAAALQFATSFNAAMTEANKLFDYHMQQMALALQDSNFEQIEQRTLPGITNSNFDFVVQVWSEDGARVYQSRSHRTLPLQAILGYSTVTLENGDWRVYAVRANKRVVQVAQKIDTRRDRAITLAFSALWPVIPVSLMLFAAAWWVVSSALAPLNRIGQELANRNADSIAPVSDRGVPQEVSLLVTELNSLLARMAQALQSQQQFVADAAHELRSPITALRLQVQTLARSKDELALAQGVTRLLGGVDRAARLVEQLLALAREEPSASNAELLPVSLSNCVELAIADVSPFALSKNIGLQAKLQASARITGDAESLRVMVRNLLDNAIRYIPENGLVQIDLSADKTGVQLRIQDDGEGISIQDRARIFDRFYRVPGTNTSGSGLGLAIAKSIADRHKANMELADADLGGLVVRIRFAI